MNKQQSNRFENKWWHPCVVDQHKSVRIPRSRVLIHPEWYDRLQWWPYSYPGVCHQDRGEQWYLVSGDEPPVPTEPSQGNVLICLGCGLENKNLPTVYLFCNGEDAMMGDHHAVAMADDGEVLLSWTCSNHTFFRYDLHDRHNFEGEGVIVKALYEQKFGGFGDGKFYQLVECDLFDIPVEVRERSRKRDAEGMT